MSDLLYSKEVLRLAAAAKGAGRLPEPRLSGSAHNPACGDRVTVDLRLEDGHVAALAHETKACVLAQASASILADALPGLDVQAVATLRAAVSGMLAGDGHCDAFEVLADAARFPSRHRCVLLPFDAALKAFEAGEPRSQGAE
jgi:NifU-like protein involved in Fe-S cluster formation